MKCASKTNKVLQSIKAGLLGDFGTEQEYKTWAEFIYEEGVDEWEVEGVSLNDPQLDTQLLFRNVFKREEERVCHFDESSHFRCEL